MAHLTRWLLTCRESLNLTLLRSQLTYLWQRWPPQLLSLKPLSPLGKRPTSPAITARKKAKRPKTKRNSKRKKKKMPNKSNRLRRKFILSVGLVARITTLRKDVGKAQERTSNPNAPDLFIQMITIQILKCKNFNTHQPCPILNLQSRMMIRKTSYATSPM